MTFAQTMDNRWRRRHHSAYSCRRNLPVMIDPYVWTKPLSCAPGCIAAAAAAAGGATGDRYSLLSWHPYQVPCAHATPKKRMGSPPFILNDGRCGDDITAVGSDELTLPSDCAPMLPRVDMAAFGGLPKQGAGEKDVGFGWKDGLGQIARVLACSVKKRKLLCDRKDPFAHLTPRRLAITVMKSGVVVGAPMLNQVVLDSLDDLDDSSSSESRQGRERGRGGGNRGYLLGDGRGNRGGRAFVNSEGRVVLLREGEGEEDGEKEQDWMKALATSFKCFPSSTFRRVLHSVMALSTQRLLEWQAVVNLSTRAADRLTKNLALSALRKTKRMSRSMAAAKMYSTAGKALCFQNLAMFIADELFLAVQLGLKERRRRKENPYARTDWPELLREMRAKSVDNATFALFIWAAGTAGAMVGTFVLPNRGPELLSMFAEMGASTLLN